MGIREGMPLLAKHEGDWEGTYIYLDPNGQIIDQHASHLTCSFPEGKDYEYYQVNRYTWPDGRKEVHEFPAKYDGFGRIRFDTDRIDGWTWGVDENAIYLSWIYKEKGTDLRLYELIVLSDDGNNRCRTWQWVRNGEIEMRTIINEKRITTEEQA